jgi:DNA-binding PadR family transcriptional regulator
VAGRRRRVYCLTMAGRDALAKERRSWTGLVASVEAVLRPLPPAAEALS